MQNVSVQTAQNVAIEYPVAGVGDRILATLADGLILFAYGLFAVLIVLPILPGGVGSISILLYLPILFYHVVFEVLMDGQSIGKRLLKIRVVRLDGTAPTLGNYLMRWITRQFEILLFWGVPALIAVLLSERGQRLGDMAAGTCVVKLTRAPIGETLFQSLDEEYVVENPEVRKLTDGDVDIVKEVLRAYTKAGRTPHTRAMVDKTVAVVSAKMGVSTKLPGVVFLRAVVKDYNAVEGNLSAEGF